MPVTCPTCAGSGVVTYAYATCPGCNGAGFTTQVHCAGNGSSKCSANHPGVVIYNLPQGRACITCDGKGAF